MTDHESVPSRGLTRRSVLALPIGLALANGVPRPTVIAQERAAASDAIYRGDAARTGQGMHPISDPQAINHLLWYQETDGVYARAPVIADGIAHVGWAAVNITTGEMVWQIDPFHGERTPPDRMMASAPTIADGTVYFCAGSLHLVALDAKTGETRWMIESDKAIGASYVNLSPVVRDGVAYFTRGEILKPGQVVAVDTETGKERWATDLVNEIRTPPSLFGDYLLAAASSQLVALDIASGIIAWEYREARFANTIAIAEGVAYATHGSYAVAVEIASGKELWSVNLGRRVAHAPAVAGGRVFVVLEGAGPVALSADDGSTLWKGDDWATSAPTIVDDVVYLGMANYGLTALEAATGRVTWQVGKGKVLSPPIATASGVLYRSDTSLEYWGEAQLPVATVMTEAALLEDPAADAEVVATLPVGTILTVTGDPILVDDLIFFPVSVMETGVNGWIDSRSIDFSQ